MRRKMSDRSKVSTVMPWRCRVTSSMRTVLKGVVRAPIAPTTIPFIPFTTRQIRSNSSTLALKRSLPGRTVCGFSAVNLTPYWRNTSMIEILPQKESRRRAGPMRSNSSG